MVARDAANGVLPPWCSRPSPGQGGVGTRLVQTDQVRRIDGGDLVSPGGPRCLVPFPRRQRLLLSGKSRRRSSHDSVATLTRTPVLCSPRAQRSASVASGSAVT